MTNCAATPGGHSLDGVDLTTQAVIEGKVISNSSLIGTGYVRLLDRNDEFVAEVPLNSQCEFRFFTYEGNWKLKVIIPNQTKVVQAQAKLGSVTNIDVLVN